MKLRAFLTVALFVVASQLSAAFVNGKLLFEENFGIKADLNKWQGYNRAVYLPTGGENGSGAVKFTVKNIKKSRLMTIKLDPGKVKGLIRLEALVKGENLKQSTLSYLGSKMMIAYTTKKRKKYLEPPRRYGNYDWRRISKVIDLSDSIGEISLNIGIQLGIGTYYVSDIKIYQCTKIDGKVNAANKPQNKAFLSVPRGENKGARYRGVMSGRSLGEKDFSDLSRWGVNLMRYQIIMPRKERGENDTSEKYLAWIDSEIEKLDKILVIAKKYNIKLALDLHTGPGTRISKVASNILKDNKVDLKTLTEAWLKLAVNFKNSKNIYGYDLLNEPKASGEAWHQIAQSLVNSIRQVDPDTPIIVAIPDTGKIELIKGKNIIYTVHYYSPHSFTHQGLGGRVAGWSYPGVIDDVYWDVEQIHVKLKNVIEFQKKYNVPIFVGEFGVVCWAKGADKYLRDCIAVFEEYGWDWTYHAFREFRGWSIEHAGDSVKNITCSENNPRKKVMLKAFKKNKE